eukprot:s2470_g9.t1
METEASHEVKESGLAGNLTAAGVGAEVDFERQKSMFSFLCSSRGLVVVPRDLARSAAGSSGNRLLTCTSLFQKMIADAALTGGMLNARGSSRSPAARTDHRASPCRLN